MASNRALLILALLAAGSLLAVFVDLWGLGAKPTPQRRLLPAECRPVQALSWSGPALATPGGVALADDGTTWQWSSPGRRARGDIGGAVNQPAMVELADMLAVAHARRRVPSSPEARRERGLSPASVVLEVGCRSGSGAVLSWGDALPGVDRVWLRRVWLSRTDAGSGTDGGDADADSWDYIVEGYWLRTLQRAIADARQRRPFATLLHAAPTTPTAIAVTAGGETFSLRGVPWTVQFAATGARVRAQRQRAEALMDRMSALEMAYFTDTAAETPPLQADSPKQAAAQPSRAGGTGANEIVLETRDAGDAALHRHYLRVRGPCRAPPEPQDDMAASAAPGRYLLVDTSIGGGCIRASGLDEIWSLAGDAADMVSRALVPVDGELLRITVDTTVPVELGQSGDGRWALSARGSGWRWAYTGDERGDDGGTYTGNDNGAGAGGDADSGTVQAWIAALLRAPAGPVMSAKELDPGPRTAQFWLDFRRRPRQRLQVFRAQSLGKPSSGIWLARRDEEPVYIALNTAQAERIVSLSVLSVRERQIWLYDRYSVRTIAKYRGRRLLARMRRGPLLNDWQIDVPVGASLAPGVAERVRARITQVRALSFVADKPGREHGLSPPLRRIVATFDAAPLATDANDDQGQRRILDIGKPATDADMAALRTADSTGDAPGCYARADEAGPVFIIAASVCAAFLQSWEADN